jgi:hypothetical protein
MKSGRPSYHIPAKWITVNLQQGMRYFELDKKGNLLNKITHPHQIVNHVSQARIETPTVVDVDVFGTMDDFTDFDFSFDMSDGG